MFRLISLNLNDDNVLGHIPKDKLVFIPESEMETSGYKEWLTSL